MVLPMLWLGTILALANDDQATIAALKAKRDDAIFRVQDIVNQPITHLKRTPDMIDVAEYPVWFHPGAETPDFDHVDVRTSQQFVYQGKQYVTSYANPGEVFLGSELEFNSMTKYFYTDRSLPKKKLSEAEMLEINQLYRVIGQCDQQLKELENPDPPQVKIQKWIVSHKPAVIGLAFALLVVLVVVRKISTPKYSN